MALIGAGCYLAWRIRIEVGWLLLPAAASLALLGFLFHGLLVPAADPWALAQAFELLASDG